MHTKPPVLLLGSDCLTGLQIARILHRRGIAVLGVAGRVGSPYCRSRAVTRTLTEGVLDDPKALLDPIATEFGARPVVLACTDEHAWWLSTHRADLEGLADFLLPDRGVFELLSDKARFYPWIAEQGLLPIPETRIVEHPEEIERAAREMRFPLVVKPPRKSAAWRAVSAGAKVLWVADAAELLEAAPRLRAGAGPLVLQSWISGPDTQSREFSFCLDGQGALVAGVVLQKLRQWPPGVGTATLAVEVRDDEIVERGLELLARVGFVGPGQLEFKRDVRDGRLYVIEINPGRAALNFPLCEASGIEMTERWYRVSAGLPLPAPRAADVSRSGARWICWKRDLLAAFAAWRRGELTLRAWLRSVRGPRWSADVAFDDPVPLIADLAGRLPRAILGLARRASGMDPGRSAARRDGRSSDSGAAPRR